MDVFEKLTNNILFCKKFNLNRIKFCLTELIYLFFTLLNLTLQAVPLFSSYRLLTAAIFVELIGHYD